MRSVQYEEQVRLLLQVLPIIDRENWVITDFGRTPLFGLKGGTAINLFIENLPRLSVDIDLTYLLLDSRETALT